MFACGESRGKRYATPVWQFAEYASSTCIELSIKGSVIARVNGVSPSLVVHAIHTAYRMGRIPIGPSATAVVSGTMRAGPCNDWYHDYVVRAMPFGAGIAVDYRWDCVLRVKEASA